MNLVRELLKVLHTKINDDPVLIHERLSLSPPAHVSGYAKKPTEVDRHVDLLVKIGLAKKTTDQLFEQRGNLEKPVVTLEPTQSARQWARIAYADSAWEENKTKLRKLIESRELASKKEA